jgi:adenylate cyclase
MALEIEHKFLLKNSDWKALAHKSSQYKQGYMISDSKRSVRVRISDDKAWLNIKSATIGNLRQEFEYAIPVDDGIEILNTLCEKPIIEKTRYFVTYEQHIWEIDVFYGDNEGLIVAEVELSKVGEKFSKPSWIGNEVTDDLRYYNNSLCKKPYKSWKNKN